MKTLTLYECQTAHCSLGAAGVPGHFTGGISAEEKHKLTGQPVEEMIDGADYGEGVCPNCGLPGDPAGEHTPVGAKAVKGAK